jgi:hypothetical protein
MPAAINLARDTSPSFLCLTGPALQPRPLSWHKECFLLYFFGTCGAPPAGQRFNPWPCYPNSFALMIAGIESLVAAFALHA